MREAANTIVSLTRGAAKAIEEAPMLSLQHVSKAYGPTKATRDVSVEIPSGEIVGLLGANGAGKSTLIKILSGIVRPDEGAIQFEGNEVAGPHWGPSAARNAGIRVVHQELSLCTNLTVYENFFLESPQLGSNPLLLAKRYVPMAKEALDKIFPGHGIDCRSSVQKLTIAERQMVEIARAASDPNLRLLILDEPSSSLDRDRSAQLSAYLQSLAQQGILSFYISHKLAEVVALVTHVLVLRNGELVWNGPASEITTQSIIAHMGGKDSVTAPSTPSKVGAARDRAVLLTIGRDDPLNATGSEITFRDSEVIGFAGLEGNGQREALWRVKKMHGKASYVSGDRRTDGVFPISSVLDNATISATAVRGMFRTVSRSQDESAVLEYFDRLRLPRDRADNNILTLSGGNQQKALMVRALATGNPVTLLDDPTRGVDIGVKQEFYAIIRQSADQGCRLIIWNSSEDTEFAMCDRVCVFSGGRIQKVISGADATKSELVAAAFESNSGQQAAGLHGKDRSYLLSYLAPASMMALLVWAASLNPNIASYNGIDLVLGEQFRWSLRHSLRCSWSGEPDRSRRRQFCLARKRAGGRVLRGDATVRRHRDAAADPVLRSDSIRGGTGPCSFDYCDVGTFVHMARDRIRGPGYSWWHEPGLADEPGGLAAASCAGFCDHSGSGRGGRVCDQHVWVGRRHARVWKQPTCHERCRLVSA